MTRLLKDDDGFPIKCDYIYATVVADELGQAATLYWARCHGGFGHPLTLLDWDVDDLRPATWSEIGAKIAAFRKRCGQRYEPQWSAFVEGEALTQQAKLRGAAAKAIYNHLTIPDAWPALCQVAAQYRDADAVKMTKTAAGKIAGRMGGFAGLPRRMPGPRSDDPVTPAWLYGIAIGLDPSSARPPPPAKVVIAKSSQNAR